MQMRWMCCLLLWCSCQAFAADITVTGNWSAAITRDDLTGGAGTNLRSPIESNSGQVTLDILNTGGATWMVMVARNDINWPVGVALALRRTSTGAGTGAISGGAAYLSLGPGAQTFLTGSGDRTGIQIQLKSDGMSVKNIAGLYNGTISYVIQ
jgi:hypothetical protein